VVLIDDQPLTIQGIGAWLAGTGRFSVAGTAANVARAQKLLESLDPLPDLVILDLALGEEDGLALIPALREMACKREAPLPGIVTYSTQEDPFFVYAALEAGTSAFAAKSADLGELTAAMDAALAGEVYSNPDYEVPVRKWASYGLSPREREVAALIKRSLSNKGIAKRLGISVRTVENHLSHIYVKSNTFSR
jgi:NarL family two-component system response regulator LiaR